MVAMWTRSAVAAIALMLISAGGGAERHLCRGFLPDEDVGLLGIAADQDTGITEAQYNEALDLIEAFYSPYFKNHFNASLVVDRLWESTAINAYAYQRLDQWHVEMHGGIARHPDQNPWGFLLVACHEVGHHIGGAPKKFLTWASSEGQSDYFAGLSCFRHVLRAGIPNWPVTKIDQAVISACGQQFPGRDEQKICQLASMGAFGLAHLMGGLKTVPVKPKFETPDANEIESTADNHPHPQCRLDTYFQASLCPTSAPPHLITENAKIHTCWADQGMATGTRRRCWFQPTDFKDGKAPDFF